MEREGEAMFGRPVPKEQPAEAWMRFKSVAHLWAAALYTHNWGVMDQGGEGVEVPADPSYEGCEPEVQAYLEAHQHSDWAMRLLLSTAEEFQRFGLSFKPRHGRKTLLDPDTMWRLEEMPEWRVGIPDVRFEPAVIEKLNDYLA